MITLRQAIDKTLTRVSLASGADSQTYAEEQLRDIIQHKFNMLFDNYWWPQFYCPGEAFTLDGSTGVVTGDLTAKIKRYMDIRHIWLGTYSDPLPRLNTRYNPTYTNRSCYAAFAGVKIFKVYPVNTTGNITVSYRIRPNDFEDEDDIIDMDADLIVLGAAYDYLNALGTNPEEEAKLLQFFNNRLKVITDAIEGGEVAVGSYQSSSINGWQEV